jgi:hypothetical protein
MPRRAKFWSSPSRSVRFALVLSFAPSAYLLLLRIHIAASCRSFPWLFWDDRALHSCSCRTFFMPLLCFSITPAVQRAYGTAVCNLALDHAADTPDQRPRPPLRIQLKRHSQVCTAVPFVDLGARAVYVIGLFFNSGLRSDWGWWKCVAHT